jgi:hypothetical protein
MQAAEHWDRDDVPLGKELRGHRGLLAEPLVRACAVVVADVLGDEALEVPVLEHQEESGAGESHPRALAEPYVSLSTHTAPIYPVVAVRGSKCQWAKTRGSWRATATSQ